MPRVQERAWGSRPWCRGPGSRPHSRAQYSAFSPGAWSPASRRRPRAEAPAPLAWAAATGLGSGACWVQAPHGRGRDGRRSPLPVRLPGQDRASPARLARPFPLWLAGLLAPEFTAVLNRRRPHPAAPAWALAFPQGTLSCLKTTSRFSRVLEFPEVRFLPAAAKN